jgi:undecaprenyl-diphosphatase
MSHTHDHDMSDTHDHDHPHDAGRHDAGTVSAHDDRPPIDWRSSPIDRHGWLVMFTAFVVGTGVMTLIGLAIVEWWDTGSLGDADADLNRWLEDARNDTLTELSHIGSAFSDTLTKIVLGVLLLPIFLWAFRRWNEYAFVFGGLLLEVSIFGLSSELVGRSRPPVEQLDGAPTNSFPSGHIAASVVFYAGIGLIVYWRSTARWERVVAVVLAAAGPTIVIAARLYLGMHYPTDAVAGVVLGGSVLMVMAHVVDVRSDPPGWRADSANSPGTVALHVT